MVLTSGASILIFLWGRGGGEGGSAPQVLTFHKGVPPIWAMFGFSLVLYVCEIQSPNAHLPQSEKIYFLFFITNFHTLKLSFKPSLRGGLKKNLTNLKDFG